MALLKFFHVLFVFVWIGGLMTVSGFMAHQKESSKELSRLFKRIYFSVELPAMLLAVAFGLILLFTSTTVNLRAPWLHMKLTFAALLVLADIITGCEVVRLQKEGNSAGRVGHLFLHYIAFLCLIGVLVAIYLVK